MPLVLGKEMRFHMAQMSWRRFGIFRAMKDVFRVIVQSESSVRRLEREHATVIGCKIKEKLMYALLLELSGKAMAGSLEHGDSVIVYVHLQYVLNVIYSIWTLYAVCGFLMCVGFLKWMEHREGKVYERCMAGCRSIADGEDFQSRLERLHYSVEDMISQMQALREDDRETRQMSWIWHELDVVKGQIQEWIGRFVIIERAVERQQSKEISDAEFARRDTEAMSRSSSYLDDTTWADQLREEGINPLTGETLTSDG